MTIYQTPIIVPLLHSVPIFHLIIKSYLEGHLESVSHLGLFQLAAIKPFVPIMITAP